MEQEPTTNYKVLTKSELPHKPAVKRVRHYIKHAMDRIPEAVLFFTASALIPRLSRKSALRFGYGLGSVCYRTLHSYRKIAFANLDIVYGDAKTAEEKKAIVKASMCNFGQLITDYFWFGRNTDSRLGKHNFRCDENIEEWLSGDKPGIFVTMHLGNWELAGQYIASRNREICSVYRPIGSSFVSSRLFRFRSATGQRVIPREGAIPGIIRALKHGDLVAFLLDQHTDVTDGGVYRDFFGLPATFSSAPGILAHRMGVPVCVAAVLCDMETDSSILTGGKVFSAEDCSRMSAEKINQEIVKAMEKIILTYPEQWLWMYRRWKRYTRYHDASKFPYYAKLDEYVV